MGITEATGNELLEFSIMSLQHHGPRFSDRIFQNQALEVSMSFINNLVLMCHNQILNFKLVDHKFDKVGVKYCQLIESKLDDQRKYQELSDIKPAKFESSIKNKDFLFDGPKKYNLGATKTVSLAIVAIIEMHMLLAYLRRFLLPIKYSGRDIVITSLIDFAEKSKSFCLDLYEFGPPLSSLSASLPRGNDSSQIEIEHYLTQNYGGFCVIDTYLGRSGYFEEIRRALYHDTFLPNFEDMRVNVSIVMGYILMTNLGRFTSILGDIDIPIILFCYDPQYVVFQAHHKRINHLERMRHSYLEDWKHHLVNTSKSEPSRSFIKGHRTFSILGMGTGCFKMSSSRGSENPKELEGMCNEVVMDRNQFVDYFPAIRSRSWRRWIFLSQSVMIFTMAICGLTFGILVYVYMVFRSSETVERNRELVAILRQEHQNSTNPHIERIRLVLLENLAAISARYIIIDREHLAIDKLANLLADMISPIEFPSIIFWAFVELGVAAATLRIVSVLMIYFLTLADLMFGLIEIELKMDISSALLRIYKNDEGNEMGHIYSQHKDEISNSPMIKKLYLKHKEQAICDSIYHFDLYSIISYVLKNFNQRQKFCYDYARRLLEKDEISGNEVRLVSGKFLISTYLDFREFRDQIDQSRACIHMAISYGVIGTGVIILTFLSQMSISLKLILGFISLAPSVCIFSGVSVFRSQATMVGNCMFRLIAASAIYQDDTRFLSALWRKCTSDLSGPHSKFDFKFWSITISHAGTLQYLLMVASIFLLTTTRRSHNPLV